MRVTIYTWRISRVHNNEAKSPKTCRRYFPAKVVFEESLLRNTCIRRYIVIHTSTHESITVCCGVSEEQKSNIIIKIFAGSAHHCTTNIYPLILLIARVFRGKPALIFSNFKSSGRKSSLCVWVLVGLDCMRHWVSEFQISKATLNCLWFVQQIKHKWN